MNIRPANKSTTTTPSVATVTKQPPNKTIVGGTKKIDMGAAASFGKKTPNSAAGIHSPTHRDTPADSNNDDDLIGYSPINNNISLGISDLGSNITPTTTNNNNVENLFPTCSPKMEKTLNSAAVITDDLDDFNPRAVEQPQGEFGDFTSAFGDPPSSGLATTMIATAGTGNDDFADFSAFHGSTTTSSNTITGGLEDNLLTTATPANDAFDLFNSATSTNSNAVSTAVMGATTATDLLAGLGDLSIHQSMPMGKLLMNISIQSFICRMSLYFNIEYSDLPFFLNLICIFSYGNQRCRLG